MLRDDADLHLVKSRQQCVCAPPSVPLLWCASQAKQERPRESGARHTGGASCACWPSGHAHCHGLVQRGHHQVRFRRSCGHGHVVYRKAGGAVAMMSHHWCSCASLGDDASAWESALCSRCCPKRWLPMMLMRASAGNAARGRLGFRVCFLPVEASALAAVPWMAPCQSQHVSLTCSGSTCLVLAVWLRVSSAPLS